MVKRLLDKGTYDITQFKLDIDYRGRSTMRFVGLGKSQEKDVEFELKIQSHVVKGWPEVRDAPPKHNIAQKTQKRGPGRPPSIDN